jgi:hypothetical protein
MQARPVAGDEPGDPVCYAVALHVLMSQAEMELWESFADRHRLEMDDATHAAALSGLKYRLKHAGDESGTHVAAVCEREVLARLGLEAGNGAPRPGWGIEPR